MYKGECILINLFICLIKFSASSSAHCLVVRMVTYAVCCNLQTFYLKQKTIKAKKPVEFVLSKMCDSNLIFVVGVMIDHSINYPEMSVRSS